MGRREKVDWAGRSAGKGGKRANVLLELVEPAGGDQRAKGGS